MNCKNCDIHCEPELDPIYGEYCSKECEKDFISRCTKTICVIDVETTGLNPNEDDIWQICILPLTSDFNPDFSKTFYGLIKPISLDYIDWDIPVFRQNRHKMEEALSTGYTRNEIIAKFVSWVDDKYILPLGHNYSFDKSFLQALFGVELYGKRFDYHHRDTMCAALFINDIAHRSNEKDLFPEVSLSSVCKKLGLPSPTHDAMTDCLSTARVYNQITTRS